AGAGRDFHFGKNSRPADPAGHAVGIAARAPVRGDGGGIAPHQGSAMTTPPARKPSAALPLLIYNLFFPLAFIAMLPGLARRMVRRGNYRRKFGQRFARYDDAVLKRLAGGGRVWVHSISVGETLLALRLIRQMR